VMIIAMAAGGRVHPRCGDGPITGWRGLLTAEKKVDALIYFSAG